MQLRKLVSKKQYKISSSLGLKGEPHIDFRMQCVIVTLTGRGAITNDILKFRKVIEFQRSSIAICFSYIYLFIDGKRSCISKESSSEFRKMIKD